MGLNWVSDVSIESWVEMRERVPTRCEVDHLNDRATLFFGQREDFVLHLCRDSLRRVADLAAQAHTQLEAHTRFDHTLPRT